MRCRRSSSKLTRRRRALTEGACRPAWYECSLQRAISSRSLASMKHVPSLSRSTRSLLLPFSNWPFSEGL